MKIVNYTQRHNKLRICLFESLTLKNRLGTNMQNAGYGCALIYVVLKNSLDLRFINTVTYFFHSGPSSGWALSMIPLLKIRRRNCESKPLVFQTGSRCQSHIRSPNK